MNTVLTMDQVVEELWEQDPPAGAAQTVHAHIARIRKDLAAWLPEERVRIDWSHPGYVLRAPAERVDLCAFSTFAAGCAEAWPTDPARAAECGRQALALWRGAPFSGHDLGPTGRIARVRLEETRLATLETVMDARLELGLHRQQVGELKELVAANPYRERFHEQLIIALYRSQRQGEALEVYHSARLFLSEELGVEPSPQLRRTAAQVLRHDPALRHHSDALLA
ncbi:DNA-binding SARP family transcriptional activator [Crossiella equi]|uniref:DNA-binding SARP family transcriptional activator n=1 Tax=Crossiella equi TaxID=130796 RepID=A0ABS5ARN4_9PSEU|nr:DNA-binding SARP family transcriptional activator [Crossiella equi]